MCSVRSSRGGKAVPNRLLLLMFLLCVHFCAFRPRRGALSLLYKHRGSYNTRCLLLHESLTLRSTIIITDSPVLPVVCVVAIGDSEYLCVSRPVPYFHWTWPLRESVKAPGLSTRPN